MTRTCAEKQGNLALCFRLRRSSGISEERVIIGPHHVHLIDWPHCVQDDVHLHHHRLSICRKKYMDKGNYRSPPLQTVHLQKDVWANDELPKPTIKGSATAATSTSKGNCHSARVQQTAQLQNRCKLSDDSCHSPPPPPQQLSKSIDYVMKGINIILIPSRVVVQRWLLVCKSHT